MSQNPVERHHDAEVDHLVVVAAEHDADDVLADVVDVALDGGQHDRAWPRATEVGESTAEPTAAAAFSASMKGSRYATACFIARALFTTCGRNILPAPNRSPTIFMPSISGPSMTSSGRGVRLPRFFDVRLDEVDDAVHERVREPFLDRCLAPGQVVAASVLTAAVAGVRELHETLGGVGPPVEQQVLDVLEQFGVECPRTRPAGRR